MIIKFLICSVTLTCVYTQMMPLMPPQSSGNQGTVSFSELVALMAMRNQLPVGDQQYTLLNLTGGQLPPTPDLSGAPIMEPAPAISALQPEQTLPAFQPGSALSPLMPGPVLPAFQPRPALPVIQPGPALPAVQSAPAVTAVKPAPMPARPAMPRGPSAAEAVQNVLPSAVSQAVQAALPQAVQTAIQSTLPQTQSQSAAVAVQKTLPSVVTSAVQAALPEAVKKAVQAALPAAVQSAVKAAVPAVVAVPGTTPKPKPKYTGPPPACKGTCPPKWVATVQGFTGVLKPSNPLCKYKTFMSECHDPNKSCKPGYSCCPVSCLKTLIGCYQGDPITYMCLPDDISQWWPEMVQTFMKATGLSAMIPGAMGGGMAGGMGGGMMGANPMATMMGGMMGGMGFKKK